MNEPLLSSQPDTSEGVLRWFLASAGLFLAGIIALGVDRSVAAWCLAENMSGDLKKFFTISETFGHGTGIMLILVTMFVLDPENRRRFPRIIACLVTSGVLGANLIKLVVARYRPKAFGEAFGFDQSIFASFHSFFPFGEGGHDLQSLPSAHTTAAVTLACCLAWVYPRGRWWFGVLAFLVAMQRISSGAHFISDTCFGAALGLLVSAFFIKVGPLASAFTRLERRG